jgi:hypothetical protein
MLTIAQTITYGLANNLRARGSRGTAADQTASPQTLTALL